METLPTLSRDMVEKDLHAQVQELMVELAVLNERLRSSDSALVMQRSESDRRLTELNHAHARAESVLNSFTPRELFERNAKDLSDRLERSAKETNEWRQKVETFMSNNAGRNKGISDFMGWIVAAVVALAALASDYFRVR